MTFYIVKRDFINSRNVIIGKYGSNINALLGMEDEAFKYVIANKGIYDKIYNGIGINDKLGRNEHFICKGDLADELFIYRKEKDCGYMYNSYRFVKIYSLVVCREDDKKYFDNYKKYFLKINYVVDESVKECMDEIMIEIKKKEINLTN